MSVSSVQSEDVQLPHNSLAMLGELEVKTSTPSPPTRPTESKTRADPGSLPNGDPLAHNPLHQPEAATHPIPNPPCGCAKEGRNLIVCIDGTSNQFGKRNTNVIELYSLIRKGKGDNQRTYYNSGIGTYAIPSWRSWAYYKQVVGHKMDLAIAWNFESIVLDAYRWLSETYEDGDCIYFFGFSRGAYQVRTLSAMIHRVGLIHRGNEKQIPFAYQLYSHSEGTGAMDSVTTAQTFKTTFSREVKVHVIGAWDTVSSIGLVRGRKLLPDTINGMKHVCFFRHALALDERRVKFLPEYAYGGSSPQEAVMQDSLELAKRVDAAKDRNERKEADSTPKVNVPHTKEVWFAGTHSDIGGGNVGNESLDLTRPSLRWMYSEADAAGLALNPLNPNYKLFAKEIDIHESLTWAWLPLEVLPFRHLTYGKKANRLSSNSADTTYLPHRGGARIIQEGQKIHQSLWGSQQLGSTYTPRAKAKFKWAELGKQDNAEALRTWKEIDLYDLAGTVVRKYADSKSTGLEVASQQEQRATIRAYASSGESRRALIRELTARKIRADIFCDILDILVESADPESTVKVDLPYRLIAPVLLDDLRSTDVHQCQTARKVMEYCAKVTRTVRVLTGHYLAVSSVAFSPDGTRIASGSYDNTIRIWDAVTGETVGKPLQGHTDWVWSVAFSPDGVYVVSGSDDRTVRVWDVEKGQAVWTPFEGHTDWVRSVVFSPDGKRVVSGSCDATLRIWDAETGQTVGGPLEGHTNSVWSVAFSPDGSRVVSGSGDQTIRIWKVETGQMVGEPLEGHTDMVWSVAFSPDGKRVVSGSGDKTIRIWNSETGKAVGKPFEGHGGAVISVAFSPDGQRIVSGSADCTVRIWDVETGEMVGKPYEGHTNWVWSVAFSPDGTRVVSGSRDKTTRIWDVLEPLLPQAQEVDVHENAIPGSADAA
ncbi:unnamed protein product [Peniophora sp. CBMAI 1063]|nr:unnamed protein product [Peniophora sp. CBMAI 1063]